MNAGQLRRSYLQYFADSGHHIYPSEGLIPHHSAAPLFTNSGMVQFLPYFLEEETPTYRRAASIQKCVRVRGKHDDIEQIGRTTRHFTFFEMLGNFSFGDYFKEEAIQMHWDLFTNVLGVDGDRIWVTVHESDDEASEIWRETIKIPSARIQRMGADNFWEMADTGPCGPSSELFYDKGPEFGHGGGPVNGHDERFMEFGNLVFTSFDRQKDGSLVDLPHKNIDQGTGFERVLSFINDVGSVWETDVIRSVISGAESVTGATYGRDPELDVSLRIIADHSRAMTVLVSDGVYPSNEDRGYVLRRIVRRMLRHAARCGSQTKIATQMVNRVVEVMGEAYPELVKNREFVCDVLEREERRFRQTLLSGSNLLDKALLESETVSGETAFRLHGTYGFPIELTQEIANERGKSVDIAAYQHAMDVQRETARSRSKRDSSEERTVEAYRRIADSAGPTLFIGYERDVVDSEVVAVLSSETDDSIEIFLASTPFYAEQGGQVGDTGEIRTKSGVANVVDTMFVLPGLIGHKAELLSGAILPGEVANAAIDRDRREKIRKNHTGTHVLHWALRHVLGSHVKQAGSLVAPDRLRFDFNHWEALTAEQIAAIELVANNEVLTDAPVEVVHSTKEEALSLGAIAFFGDKYGDEVRMLRAGANSLELCGGTHVSALGQIGLIKVVNETSIGSNIRRIEAVTGVMALDFVRHEEQLLQAVAEKLKTSPPELEEALARLVSNQKQLDAEIRGLRAQLRKGVVTDLTRNAKSNILVQRLDDISADELREIAIETKTKGDFNAVVLIGTPDGGRVSLVAAVKKDGPRNAGSLILDAARVVGGGGGKGVELAIAGGRHVEKIDEAISIIRKSLGISTFSVTRRRLPMPAA